MGSQDENIGAMIKEFKVGMEGKKSISGNRKIDLFQQTYRKTLSLYFSEQEKISLSRHPSQSGQNR